MSRQVFLFASAFLLTAVPAGAQESDQAAEVQHRNDCRLAAQVLATGHPHPRHEWAVREITSCADEGPAYYAASWAAPASDTAGLRDLIVRSTRWRDARTYAALREAATDRARSDAVRVAAMISLARYVDPTIWIDLTDLRVPERLDRIRVRGATWYDVVQMPGAQPLGTVTAEVLALLNGIAADRSGEPAEVWYAAAVLARRIELDAAARAN